MTDAERIAQLEAQLAAMKVQAQRKLSLKVTVEHFDEKKGKMVGSNGAISLYGMGRFPVTLYRSQWERLLDAADEIKSFIEVNAHLLAVKA